MRNARDESTVPAPSFLPIRLPSTSRVGMTTVSTLPLETSRCFAIVICAGAPGAASFCSMTTSAGWLPGFAMTTPHAAPAASFVKSYSLSRSTAQNSQPMFDALAATASQPDLHVPPMHAVSAP